MKIRTLVVIMLLVGVTAPIYADVMDVVYPTNRRPWDLMLHFGINFVIAYVWPESWPVQIMFCAFHEYEQKLQPDYIDMPWDTYLYKHAIPDFTADVLGVTFGHALKRKHRGK